MAHARTWLAPLVVALALVATGCDTGIDGIDGDGSEPASKPMTLIVSETWVNNHQAEPGAGGAAGGSDVRARLNTLQKAIDGLRDETGTGWVGRQDDVTGYLSELSGGSWSGTPTAFMDGYGPDLFGVDSTVLRLGEPDTVTIPGIVSTRATQAVGDVPVLDASLVFVERDGRVTGVRGRVFPGLTVLTDPLIPADQAQAIAEQASAGTAQATPSLVVLPRGAGVLAWLIPVATETDVTPPLAAANYYIDATTGDILSVQQVTGEGRVALPWAASAATYSGTCGASNWPGPSQRTPTRTRSRSPARTRSAAPSPGTASRPTRASFCSTPPRRRGTSRPRPAASGRTTPRGSGTARSCPASSWSARTPTIRDAEAMAAHALSRDGLRLLRGAGPQLLGRPGRLAGLVGALRPL